MAGGKAWTLILLRQAVVAGDEEGIEAELVEAAEHS